jgi:hypothetical protein
VTVGDALVALNEANDGGYPVVVIRRRRERLTAAPVLGVVLDEDSDEVALLIGPFSEEEQALVGASSVGEMRDSLSEVGAAGVDWPLFSTTGEEEAGDSGGSLVGFSVSDEIEVFAFLQGPKTEWEDG